jgi:hypothetical protein
MPPRKAYRKPWGGELLDVDAADVPRLQEPPGEWSNDMEQLRWQLDSVVGLHAELAKARARAQKYKPTSYRGEAVSPFLRLVERVSILMRENE